MAAHGVLYTIIINNSFLLNLEYPFLCGVGISGLAFAHTRLDERIMEVADEAHAFRLESLPQAQFAASRCS